MTLCACVRVRVRVCLCVDAASCCVWLLCVSIVHLCLTASCRLMQQQQQQQCCWVCCNRVPTGCHRQCARPSRHALRCRHNNKLARFCSATAGTISHRVIICHCATLQHTVSPCHANVTPCNTCITPRRTIQTYVAQCGALVVPCGCWQLPYWTGRQHFQLPRHPCLASLSSQPTSRLHISGPAQESKSTMCRNISSTICMLN